MEPLSPPINNYVKDKMIKKASQEDIPRLVQLNEDVQNLHHSLLPKIFKPYSISEIEKLFLKFLNDKNITILIMYSEHHEPLGYTVIEEKQHKESALTYEFQALYIHQIVVKKEVQSQGIGTTLLEEILSLAKKKDIKRIELDVWSINEKARNFFEARGYKIYNHKMEFELS